MKFKNIKHNTVHMGTFDFSVIVVVGDYSEAFKFVCWKFEDNTDMGDLDMGYEARGRCFFRRGYVPIIWIPAKPKTPREHATYAHECLHAVYHLFEWSGIPATRDTEEVMCHAMSHLITNGIK